jgi:hypothetical protein
MIGPASLVLTRLAALLAVPTAIFCVEIVASMFAPVTGQIPVGVERRGRIATLVPAHNEGAGLLPTLSDLKGEGANTQRERWEHGHIGLIVARALPLAWRSLKQRNLAAFALALDLLVPPLSLLMMILMSSTVAAGFRRSLRNANGARRLSGTKFQKFL